MQNKFYFLSFFVILFGMEADSNVVVVFGCLLNAFLRVVFLRHDGWNNLAIGGLLLNIIVMVVLTRKLRFLSNSDWCQLLTPFLYEKENHNARKKNKTVESSFVVFSYIPSVICCVIGDILLLLIKKVRSYSGNYAIRCTHCTLLRCSSIIPPVRT